MTPLRRIRARLTSTGAALCLGIDPHPDQLPAGLTPDLNGMERFARGLLEAAAPHAAAVKLNTAFFEAFGAEGWAVLERVRAEIPAELVCVIDAKRGDIGTTAERHATAIFGRLNADAVTLSPYLGEDAVDPFMAWPDRLVYLLVRTSNPSAMAIQGLPVNGEPLHLHVARWAASRWQDGRLGLVVGATDPADLGLVRGVAPGPGFLVPGVGAQGGDLVAAAQHCHGAWAPGLVAISRGIGGASRRDDWQAAAGRAAERLRASLAAAVLHSIQSAAPDSRMGGS